MQAAEALLRQAEQDTPPAPTEPPEDAKQQTIPASAGVVQPLAEVDEVNERQERLRAVVDDLMYWKGGLKVLRQAQLPKWRGYFEWQIEALQTAYARLRAEAAKEGGEGN